MRTSRTLPGAMAAAGLVLAVALTGCGNPGGLRDRGVHGARGVIPSSRDRRPWPAPPDPMERTIAAGLQPETQEHGANYVHAHLDVFVDGAPVVIPAGIGIDIANPDVRTFDEPDGSVSYGGIERCATPCISPLHTHFASGIVHTELRTPMPNTLGQFFTERGVP